MAKVLRGLVSKKKRRFQQEGFDLDLSYITPRIIAMGFPSEGKEKAFRNPYPEVKRFLETKHTGHYMVVNLCSEPDRQYSKSKFLHVMDEYQWEDHNPPPFKMFQQCCIEIKDWLDRHEKNVVALHCKAGKGRTGTMIVAYLLYSGMYDDLQQCLNYYAATRTHNSKGVTLASQKRYCRYFERSLREPASVPDPAPTLRLRSLLLTPAPTLEKLESVRFKLWVNRKLVHTQRDPPTISLSSRKPLTTKDLKDGSWDTMVGSAFADGIKNASLALPEPTPEDGGLRFSSLDIAVSDDVKFQITVGKGDKLFFFWVNTAFVENEYTSLSLRKYEVDGPHKDKACKKFAANFQVRLEFEPFHFYETEEEEEEEEEEGGGGGEAAAAAKEKEEAEKKKAVLLPEVHVVVQDPAILRNSLRSPKVNSELTLLNQAPDGAFPDGVEPRVAAELLNDLLDLVGRSEVHLTQETCERVLSDSRFKSLVARIAQLNAVDIWEAGDDEQLAFWLNVFHLLQLHAHIITGCVAVSAKLRRGLALTHAYRVCNSDLSLWKIEHGILRGKLRPPRAYYAAFQGKLELDPVQNSLVVDAPSLVCFGTSYLASGTPVLRVYDGAADMTQQLRDNAQVFLHDELRVKKQSVSMPVFLKWFQADFGEKLSEVMPIWLSLAPASFAKDKLISGFAQHTWTFRKVDDIRWDHIKLK